jgi:signal transduction histidine kinase/ActR/RegA family two-component response regulator
MFVVAVATLGAVAVTCISFAFIDARYSMRVSRQHLTATARLIAENASVSLAFDDIDAGQRLLEGLRSQPDIDSATLLHRSGRLFARYEREATSLREMTNARAYLVEQPIELNGEAIGSIRVQGNQGSLRRRQIEFTAASISVGCVVAAVALIVVRRLQTLITSPIFKLIEAAKRVTRDEDYTMRVPREADDELGTLVDCFNRMLEEISRRDAELQGQRERLELSVRERTRELREANRELGNARDRAEAASRAKSHFLANMSHEIRTPMTAILGYADVLNDPATGAEQRAESAAILRRSGEHLMSVLNDILDISKIEAGRLAIELIDIDPANIVADVASLMRVRATSKRLELHVDFSTPIPASIRGDAVRLRQVLMNLVGNAVKFTETGSVTLRVSYLPMDPSRLEFEIVDTGIGLTHEQQERIFKPFEQADDSMTRRFGGTGLGLAISQRLVIAMGGEIRVRSEIERGSVFSFSIPISMPTSQIRLMEASEAMSVVDAALSTRVEPQAQSSARQATENLRVILAEDGADNRKLIGFYLSKAGVKLRSVEDGRQCLDAIIAARQRGESFDVVITDMQMPEMDGYALSRRLREEGFDLPIIALTAHAMLGDRERCIEAGCDEYLTKPVDRNALIETLARISASPGVRRRAA